MTRGKQSNSEGPSSRSEPGEGGIRTRGGFHHTAFRERHLKPLGHLSSWTAEIVCLTPDVEPGLGDATRTVIGLGRLPRRREVLAPVGNHCRKLLPARLGD